MDNASIDRAKEHFGQIVEEQLKRVEEMKKPVEWVDYAQTRPIIIGILGGDGIGPFIAEEARKIMEFLLKDDIASGKIELRDIEGLTIENRVAHMQSIPDDVLAEIKQCHVTLKGPTTTPRTGDPWPNIESCNVAMRRYLDLFANFEKKYVMTGRDTGDTGADYAQYLMDTIVDPKLEDRWNAYQEEAIKA